MYVMSEEAKQDDVKRAAEDDVRYGADVSFPYDRVTVEQFREHFSRARWSDARQAWFVPGRTASRRFTRWLAELEAEADASPTRRAGMPSNSTRSRVLTSSLEERASALRLPIRLPSLIGFARFPIRDGMA